MSSVSPSKTSQVVPFCAKYKYSRYIVPLNLLSYIVFDDGTNITAARAATWQGWPHPTKIPIEQVMSLKFTDQYPMPTDVVY